MLLYNHSVFLNFWFLFQGTSTLDNKNMSHDKWNRYKVTLLKILISFSSENKNTFENFQYIINY